MFLQSSLFFVLYRLKLRLLFRIVCEAECIYCNHITFDCVILFINFLRKAASVKSSTTLKAIPVCLRIGTFRSMPIQIHAILLKNNFPLNIVYAKYNKFTVSGVCYPCKD